MDHIFSQELRGKICNFVNLDFMEDFLNLSRDLEYFFGILLFFLGYRTVPLISLQVWSLVLWPGFDLF